MATSSLVPGSALLLTTSTSSTRPVAKKPSMVARIEHRSAYVIRITETRFPCHMLFPQETEHANMRLTRATHRAMDHWSLTGSWNHHQREVFPGRPMV